MRKILVGLGLVGMLLGNGCASVHDVQALDIGMSKDQVKDQVGNPDSVSKAGNIEVWNYDLVGASRAMQWIFGLPTFGLICASHHYYNITFNDGKIAALEHTGDGGNGGQALAAGLKAMGDSMQQSSRNTTNCTGYTSGGYTSTSCH